MMEPRIVEVRENVLRKMTASPTIYATNFGPPVFS